MANITPALVFPGYELLSAGNAATADSIAIPLSSLPVLNPTEAALTGDGREVIRAVLETALTSIQGLSSEARPTRLIINKNQSLPVGLDNNQIRQTYTVQIDLGFSASGAEVVAE